MVSPNVQDISKHRARTFPSKPSCTQIDKFINFFKGLVLGWMGERL